MGKLITIEGTDCSGKETQSNLLVERLREHGYKVAKFSNPDYNTPTGKIIAGPYLAKTGEGYFPEGAPNVPPLVASLYYTADRLYNDAKIKKALKENDIVLIDRFTHSNLAYQGARIKSKAEREKFYNTINTIEFDLGGLTKPDFVFFLHMPTDNATELRKGRAEKADQLEKDVEYLRKAEKTYLELCKKFGLIKISCVKDGKVKNIFEINDELYKKLTKLI